jgi:preprotein translocase subunit YajC
VLNFFTTIALAADEAPASGGMGQLMSFAPLIILFVIFYFLLIRPQQKKAKEQKEMLSKLEKGDAVVTSGGIHGTITGVAEDAVTVEIAENVRVKVAKEHVIFKKKK